MMTAWGATKDFKSTCFLKQKQEKRRTNKYHPYYAYDEGAQGEGSLVSTNIMGERKRVGLGSVCLDMNGGLYGNKVINK
jgi:crotonobetainyl-CoA:carnitine CoA-transferase CaiB-like acyl-CoA transferase